MAAPLFPVNTHRSDPYRTFKFQVLIDGQVVAGLSKMGALKKTTEAVPWRVAGDPSHQRQLPGGTSYEAVSLEQGLTHDPVFANWANLVNNIDGDGAMSRRVSPDTSTRRSNVPVSNSQRSLSSSEDRK